MKSVYCETMQYIYNVQYRCYVRKQKILIYRQIQLVQLKNLDQASTKPI